MAGLGALRTAAGVATHGPADDRDQRQLLRRARAKGRFVAPDRVQLTVGRLRGQHQWPGPRQPGGHGHPRLSRQAGSLRRRRELERADDDDPAVRRRAVCGVAQDKKGLRRRDPGRPGSAQQEREVRGGVGHRTAGTRQHRTAATAGPAPRERRWPTRGKRTRCTSSRAATTPRTTCRTCSAGWAATTPCCSTAVAPRRSCCAVTPAACGPAPAPQGSCDTRQVLCDSHERALPSWLAFN